MKEIECVHLTRFLSIFSKALTRVSAFSLVKQRGGLIFITLWSNPSSLIMIWWFNSILKVKVEIHDI